MSSPQYLQLLAFRFVAHFPSPDGFTLPPWVAEVAGLEPATVGLTGRRSTVELHPNSFTAESGAGAIICGLRNKRFCTG